MALKGNSTVFLSFGPHLFNANVPLSGDPICFKLGSCFPQALFYQIGKKKNSNTSDHVIKKPSWLKKEKLLFWCSDQSIFKTWTGNIIKFEIKYLQYIHFTNVEEKNLYILAFCENKGSAKLAKKPNFLLYNAKPASRQRWACDTDGLCFQCCSMISFDVLILQTLHLLLGCWSLAFGLGNSNAEK